MNFLKSLKRRSASTSKADAASSQPNILKVPSRDFIAATNANAYGTNPQSKLPPNSEP